MRLPVLDSLERMSDAIMVAWGDGPNVKELNELADQALYAFSHARAVAKGIPIERVEQMRALTGTADSCVDI